MELQELTLRAATIQLRFRLAPRFADIRGRLIEDIKAEHQLAEYGWTDNFVQVFNLERTRTLILGSRELRFSYEHIESVDGFREAATRFMEQGLDLLDVEQVEFLGVRTYWMAAVDSFEELRESMVARYGGNEPFDDATGARLSDAGWVLEYHHENPWHTIRVGPMKVDQLLEIYFQTKDRALFPEQFFFMDYDRLDQEVEIAADQAPAHAIATFDHALQTGEAVGAWLAAGELTVGG